jgi:tape measure domain-containing protein
MTDIAKLGFEIDSSGLERAKRAAETTAQSIGKVGDAADKASGKVKGISGAATEAAQGSQRLSQAVGGLSGMLSGVAREAGSLASTLGIAGQSQGGAVLGAALGSVSRLLPVFTGSLSATIPILGSAIAGVTGLATGYVGLLGALAPLQDRYAQYVSQIQIALRSETMSAIAFEEIKKAATEAGISVDQAVGAFTRIARNAEQLGATTPQILQLTETIQKLGIISGASQGEVGSGMLQLSQALAAGRLNGDELRAILENMPALARAIADGLGVSVGELRRLGAEGQLTSEKVFKALLGQTDKVRQDFEKMPDTTERAFQRMTNQAAEFGANLGRTLGASSIVQGLIKNIEGAIGFLNRQLDNSIEARIEKLRRENELDRQLAEQTGILGAINTLGTNYLARGRIAKRMEEMANLQEQQRMLARAQTLAVEAEEDRARNAPIEQGLKVAKETDSLLEKQAKLKGQIDTLRDALTRLDERFAEGKVSTEDYAERQLKLATALQAVSSELETIGSAYEKLGRTLQQEDQARAMGGGGGGTALARRAIQLSEQSTQQGRPVSSQQAMGLLVTEQVGLVATDTERVKRQADAQANLRARVGATAAAVRELEIAQELADYRFEKFGKITTPAVEAAMKAYETQLRRTKTAQDAVANAEQIANLERTVERAKAQLGAANNPREQQRLQLEAQIADVTRRMNPVAAERVAILMRQNAALQEQLSTAERLAQMDRGLAESRMRLGTVGDPRARREFELEARIADSTRGMTAEDAGLVAGRMREQDATERQTVLTEQTQALRDQLEAVREQHDLIGLSADQERVVTAVIAKRNELLTQGVDLRSAEAREQLALATDIAMANVQLDRSKARFAEINQIGKDLTTSLSDGLTDAFTRGFSTGKLQAKDFAGVLNNALGQVLGGLTKMLMKPAMTALDTFVSSLTGNLFGSGTPTKSANGNVFLGGNVVPFARGGIVGSPTYFPMPGGTGLMGEAGPEAIMPLKRTSDGRLGVAANDPKVSVIVNDMRSGPGTEPVEIKEDRGDDGQRVISVLIRDEVRRAMRSGDLDRDFAANYGARRVIAKR